MTTIRIAKRDKFTVLPRGLVNDERLSYKARGILAWLLDKPDDWRCDSDQIAAAGKEGRDAVRAGLRELHEFGYMRREKTRSSTGRWIVTTYVYDQPTEAWNPVSGLTSTNGVNPQVAPETGKPAPDIQALSTKYCEPKTVKETEDCTSRPSRPRDALWDAVVEVTTDVSTSKEKSRRGAVVKELRAIGATPEDVAARAARYRQMWPRMTLTDTALVSHWSACVPVPVNAQTAQQKRDQEYLEQFA